jgi:hypothetical protein
MTKATGESQLSHQLCVDYVRYRYNDICREVLEILEFARKLVSHSSSRHMRIQVSKYLRHHSSLMGRHRDDMYRHTDTCTETLEMPYVVLGKALSIGEANTMICPEEPLEDESYLEGKQD